jgi:hypothetical protein
MLDKAQGLQAQSRAATATMSLDDAMQLQWENYESQKTLVLPAAKAGASAYEDYINQGY